MERDTEISIQLRRELEALPRDYTRVMATRNWDVMTDFILNFNIGRFLVFMDNYGRCIPDKIRITKFGIDGPATTARLFYDGNLFTYVIDDTRYSSGKFYIYYGHELTTKKRYMDYNEIVIDYNLISLEGNEVSIFNIWAGLKPQKISSLIDIENGIL